MSLSAILQTQKVRLLARLRGIDAPAKRFSHIEQQHREILEQLHEIKETLQGTVRREAQLRAVLMRDAELEPHLGRLERVLDNRNTAAHIAAAIDRAELQDHPFPHVVVDDVLPAPLYKALIRGLPPLELFSDRPVNKQQLTVPFRIAPVYARRVWQFVANPVVPEFVMPPVLTKFRGVLHAWISRNWPDVPPSSVQMHPSDGRIILRRRGYRIPPHRDPKWGFITGILYLARPDDNPMWGTQLYAVEEDHEARGAAPHWVNADQCRRATEVRFHSNRLLLFLNSVGAHGAYIPDDAQPETLERYIYQFRIGPTNESMAGLNASLSEERRLLWAGKVADY